MTSTWVVGDIHGCADELQELIAQLDLQPRDRFISVGDLYHRGPKPLEVAQILTAIPQFELVLGNHERVLAERLAQLPPDADLSGFEASDLAGDGGTPLAPIDPAQSSTLLEIIRKGVYFIRGEHEGQPWVVVHAGVVPGKPIEENTPFELTRVRHLDSMRGNPFWSEVWTGPELVFYGHTSSPTVRPRFVGERLVALGLDTGCVYGGALTAFRVEDGARVEVPAKQRYYPLR
ncbi:MAG: metallophosphoesterase [Planctomycetota bacterium]|jgi:hypothetical protein|nr:metallophosphoesterase [Planctomycetota bacterium]MDP6942313.1 metallophosphoesterase [Planctomycetota bacterium]